MVNADDFTYSKGYLGLLSELGASLGITFCCVPYMRPVFGCSRFRFPKCEMTAGNVDEENAETHDEASNERPLPMTENSATKNYSKSARFSVDCFDANPIPRPYCGLRRNHTFWDVSDQLLPKYWESSIYRQSPRQSFSQMDGLCIQHKDSEFIPSSHLTEKETQRFSQGASGPTKWSRDLYWSNRSYSDGSRFVWLAKSLDWSGPPIRSIALNHPTPLIQQVKTNVQSYMIL